MRFERLRIQGVRCLRDVELDLDAGMNLLIGANGAGKTSVLEAAYVLSHARSFRSNAREALLARGEKRLAVYAQLRRGNGALRRLGLGRESARWDARVDGEPSSLGALIAECAVTCFEPGSHALMAGGAEERRRYLDWGVFHVEHDYLETWRRYQRALRQRNTLLRAATTARQSDYAAWEQALGDLATQLDAARTRYVDDLQPLLLAATQTLLPELGEPAFRYRRGWADGLALVDLLASQRERDLARGHTTQGAHRADWLLSFANAPAREHLSRGQEKLAALACVLAQAELFAQQTGEWPIVGLDDLASELDEAHQATLVGLLVASKAQVLVTGTALPAALQQHPHRLFHVEQGAVRRLL